MYQKTLIFAVSLLSVWLLRGADSTKTAAPTPEAFKTQVSPLLNKSCSPCHNDRTASGGLNVAPFAHPSSLTQYRDDWEKIIQKLRSGEMPPKGMPRPDQTQIDALSAYIKGEFEKADKLVPADPGRVTARRLNRSEYSNTIRDLLAVDFRAERDFPTDDSGYGFDNIGDVLTISPILMEKYLNAAERIAARAIGADPLPKPLEIPYELKDKNLRRLDPITVEASHRVEFDAEYTIRIGLPGERPKQADGTDAKPVTLGFWMDGKLLASKLIETKPSGLVYFNPYSEEEFRLVLPEGDHTFRAGFINDEYPKSLEGKEVFNQKKNKTLNMIKFIGPFASSVEKASRKKIFVCDPKLGAPCIDKILSTLARQAYRRPVTKPEVAKLASFVQLAKSEGQNIEQGLQLAIQAMLVSPHFLFRIERDITPNDPAKLHPVSDLELASRLSYFLWSSLPDEELLTLAEKNQLHLPANLMAQTKRLLADPRSAAFASNFAGQWLETRNLDVVKPDPQKFPTWNADLREAMKSETRLFFEAILRENRPVSEFLDAKFTYLNETLAKHYGISGVTGPDFRRVELDALPAAQRGGILSQASVLTVSSYPTRTSPVIRGKYILQNVLGTPPPPPPPDVPLLDETKVGEKGSLRQQMEAHRTNAVCASCHARMDVLGFGLENYDAIGRWRTQDGKFPLDVSGTFPNGKSFATPAEMRSILTKDLGEFSHCLTEKMLTYALGRGLERYDRRTVESIQQNLASNEYKFQFLVFEIVKSLPFQQKRGDTKRTQISKPLPAKEIAAK
jgi:mono/diheme cytochrome c family protein